MSIKFPKRNKYSAVDSALSNFAGLAVATVFFAIGIYATNIDWKEPFVIGLPSAALLFFAVFQVTLLSLPIGAKPLLLRKNLISLMEKSMFCALNIS